MRYIKVVLIFLLYWVPSSAETQLSKSDNSFILQPAVSNNINELLKSSGTIQLMGACNTGFNDCSGVCVNLNTNNQNCGSCGNICTTAQSCSAGLCVAGTDNDDDGWSVENGDCDDGDENINPDASDICDGIDNNCDAVIDENASLLCPTVDSSNCSAGICTSAMCDVVLASLGTACEDANACTAFGQCNSMGQCIGIAVDCDDAEVCTTDSCDSSTGCVHTPVTNGTSCGIGLTCQEGACVDVVFKSGFE